MQRFSKALLGCLAAGLLMTGCDAVTDTGMNDAPETRLSVSGLTGSLTTQSGTVVTVNEDNLGADWFIMAQRNGGSLAFVDGPATPPYGTGSLQMAAPDLGSDKIALGTTNHGGVPIAELEGLVYSTYRDASSTAPAHVVPSINIFITNGGPNGDVTWAPLVWEPVYAYPAAAFTAGQWNEWNTMAASQTSFGGGWWSTRTLGTIDAFADYVSWETVLEQNPHATIIAQAGNGSFGVNLGTGPAGTFLGNVDGLSATFNGVTTTYNFEPKTLTKDDCKDGGWESLTDAEGNPFVNQGDCVSYFASDGKTRGQK